MEYTQLLVVHRVIIVSVSALVDVDAHCPERHSILLKMDYMYSRAADFIACARAPPLSLLSSLPLCGCTQHCAALPHDAK